MNSKMQQSTRRAWIYFMTLTGACLGLILPPALSAQTTFEKKNVPAGIQLTFPYSLAVGDFNGDGYPDLAVANAGSDPSSGQYVDGGVSILLNSPTGFTGVLEEETTGKCTVGVVSADFNGDGKLDLAASNFGSNTISILLGKGNGFFSHTGDLDTPPNPAFLVAGDFNGDGKTDLAVSNFGDNSVSLFPGRGDGTFGPKLDTGVIKNPVGLVSADFNPDHLLDLAVVGVEDDNLMVLLGKGNGSFEIANTYQTAVDPIWLIAMDLNGDGRVDLLSSNETSLSMFLNKGDGSFTGKKDYGLLSSGQLEGLVAADLDLDNNPDVVVVNQSSGYLTTIPGNGQGGLGSYVGRAYLDDGAKPIGIIAGDFNRDQKPDFAVAVSNANLISVFLNTSSRNTTTVPIVLSLAGQNNSFYTSEMTLTNRGTSGAEVAFTYTASFGGGNGTGGISLSPRQQMIVPDAITWLRTLNIPIPDSGNRGGTLKVQFSKLDKPNEAALTVRTTTKTDEGRAGLAYPDVHSMVPLLRESFLCGLRQNGQDRSNVALLHAGKSTDRSVVLRLTVVSGDPQNILVQTLPDETLTPGEFKQINNILNSNGLNVSQGFVDVEQITQTGQPPIPYYAYAVINDQMTSDGSFVPAIPIFAQNAINRLTLPVVVETAAFKSEVILTNVTTLARSVTLTYVADAIQNQTHSASLRLELQPLEQRIIPDFVQYLRDHRGLADLGPLGPTYAGALFAEVDPGQLWDASGLYLMARTSTSGGGGYYGLAYTAVPEGQTAKTVAWIYGLQQNSENRTNLALVNTGETDDSTDVFRLDIFDGDKEQQVGTIESISVEAKHWLQISSVLSRVPGTAQGYVKVTRVSGTNPFIAYAVINDGAAPGERSGDGAFIAMERGE